MWKQIFPQVSGSKTKNENIADAGGLNIAYEAFKKYERFKSEWEKLPGFENYTTGQLFFIAFGGVSVLDIPILIWDI